MSSEGEVVSCLAAVKNLFPGKGCGPVFSLSAPLGGLGDRGGVSTGAGGPTARKKSRFSEGYPQKLLLIRALGLVGGALGGPLLSLLKVLQLILLI